MVCVNLVRLKVVIKEEPSTGTNDPAGYYYINEHVWYLPSPEMEG